jgi:multidrug efflux pump subunit AcrA (membrane-fusion protein)
VEDGARIAQVPGRLTFVSPVADPASGLVEVRASIANPGGRLRAGSKAVLRIGAAAPIATPASKP